MMDVRLDDTALLRSVSASDLGLYMRSLGWSPEPEAGGIAWVENLGADDSAVVFVPRSSEMRGYSGYVRDVLVALSDRQGLSQGEVLLSVRSATRDVQFVRTHPDADSGTTPIQDSAATINGIQQWVLSAAVSVASTRTTAIQPARKPAEAADFMSTVQLGSTLPGSFVYAVYVPVPMELDQPRLDLDHPSLVDVAPPFARRVSLRLHEASELVLRAATDAANGAGGLDSFSQGVDRGISANFCEALEAMAGQRPRPFSLEFGWAAVRPVERHRRPLRFGPTQIEVIGEAARALRSREVEADVTLIGNVVRLHRESSTGRGEISLLGAIEDDPSQKLCRVWLELDEDDYRLAVAAHDDGLAVSVRGDLSRSGNRTRLTGVHGFEAWRDSS